MHLRIRTRVPLVAIAVLLLFPVVAIAQDPGYIILRRPEPTKPAPLAHPVPATRSCTGLIPSCEFIREWRGVGTSHGDMAPITTFSPVPTEPITTSVPTAAYLPTGNVPHEQDSARQGNGSYPIYRVYRQPYAYGWFGASPNATRSRSHGYHRQRTQWTFQ